MNTSLPLKGKVALIQGGSRGIGAAIATRLAADGAAVAFTFQHNADAAQAVVQAIKNNGGSALAIQADGAQEASVRAAVQQTSDAFGGLDILVNNAGVFAVGPIERFPVEDLDRTLAVNIRSVVIASQAAARVMKSGGRIINIGSTNAERMPFPGGAVYAMSKSAIQGLTKGLARDLGPRGITVNNVQPGPTDTDMNPAQGEMAAMQTQLMPVGRYGLPSEIASFVSYLAGPEAGFITGANLTIDGGFAA